MKNSSTQSSFFQQFRQQIKSASPPKTEESVVFRALVQCLVIVGIIATDIAAGTQMSFWAIPLSIMGGVWSWYRRKERNITLKFFLAIAMLGVLCFFLINLAGNLNDSRLVLAELLVQLQVLHSFDLPRRKDLGYSMVIGLILLGVAGTISQTVSFAPWLILFLVIAIPTLVLDYRSRLDLEVIDKEFKIPFQSQKKSNKTVNYSPISFKSIAVLIGITLVFGLTIFTLMPRFPGYQLQTFPVDSPLDADSQKFQGQNKGIINPGYNNQNQGLQQNRSGQSNDNSEGKGEVDDTYYYGFNTKINQNLRGEMTPKIVMRVRSQSPGFWKALSFDHYTGQGWEITNDEDFDTVKRDSWSYKFFLRFPNTSIKTKRVIQSYTAVADLPNIIPSLSFAKYLYFPAQEIGVDDLDNLRSPVGLVEGLTYTVISEVPYRDRTELQKSPPDYSEKIKTTYLNIPPEIEDKVREKTEEILSKTENPFNSPYEKVLFLTQAVKQQYQIREDLPFFNENEDLVESFLFEYEGGVQDHFASALTIMLRSLGIPARVTVGFGAGKFNPLTGFYVVKNTDAYALTEVFFPHYGWYAFDAIPGHDLFPPSLEEDQTFSVLKQFWNWIASWLPSPVANFFNLIWTKIIVGFISFLVWLWRFVSSGLIGTLIGLLLAVGFGFLGWLGWGQLRKLGYYRRLAKLPPMVRLYEEMLRVLKAKGYPKHSAQTPLEYVNVSYQQHPQEQAEIINEISSAYVSWRYGENDQNVDYLKQQFKALVNSLKRNS
ncbi:transglutaminase TgpA family protein [Crocosphaera sp. Alani8]|uniref:transglutaminase TgpA family protein n=1 Tax=Crocosphaera sp. Alani8 TaxID=3038952 RepID=UPI00313D8173